MTDYEVRRIKKIKDGYYDELLYHLRVSPAFLWFFGIEVGMIIMVLLLYVYIFFGS